MASKEELEISRSSTLRSRLAFAASCGGLDDEVCEGSEKVSEVGELMVGSVLLPENALVRFVLLASGDAVGTPFVMVLEAEDCGKVNEAESRLRTTAEAVGGSESHCFGVPSAPLTELVLNDFWCPDCVVLIPIERLLPPLPRRSTYCRGELTGRTLLGGFLAGEPGRVLRLCTFFGEMDGETVFSDFVVSI